MQQVVFHESQYFNQWWVWLVLSGYLLAVAVAIIAIRRASAAAISKKKRRIVTGFLFFMGIAPIALILSLRLDTQVRTDGIHVRFLPFYPSYKAYRWSDISDCFVREYKPVKEYGGWGFKTGLSGKAFNVSGDKGLQLILKNNNRVLIGTQKPETLAETLKKTRPVQQ